MSLARSQHSQYRNILADKDVVSDEQMQIFSRVVLFNRKLGENPTVQICRTRYWRRVAPLLEQLIWPLRKPSMMQKVLLPRKTYERYQCDLHKKLNGEFVHLWFKMVVLETGVRLDPLRIAQIDDADIRGVVGTLTGISRLWTDNGTGAAGSIQSSRCEACALGQVAADETVVLALRAAVKSRQSREQQRKHPSRLRLLRLIDVWMSESVDDSALIEANTELSERMYELRLQTEATRHRRTRRGHRQSDEPRTSRVTKPYATADDHAFSALYAAEHEIIDAYQAASCLKSFSHDLESLIPENTRSAFESTAVQSLAAVAHSRVGTRQSSNFVSDPALPQPNYTRKPVWTPATPPATPESSVEMNMTTNNAPQVSHKPEIPTVPLINPSEQSIYHSEHNPAHPSIQVPSSKPQTQPPGMTTTPPSIGSYHDRLLHLSEQQQRQRKSYARSWMELCGHPYPSQHNLVTQAAPPRLEPDTI